MKSITYLVLLVALVVCAPAPALAGDAAEQVLQQVSGNGTRSLRPFTATGPFEIQWDVAGQQFEVYEFTPEGQPLSLSPAAKQTKPGAGSSYRAKPGSYYLRILSDGDWTVTVVQLP